MSLVTAVLAGLFGVIVAALIALCLPVWASLSIALGAVALVVIGGGALLAKALFACTLVLAAVVFMRRRER